ncbi:fungal-specific transcription factor domain-containing protein [Bipolaris maydis]|nr:fungal-specific transcription factor domain-containing protein [Bipolaris maydis]
MEPEITETSEDQTVEPQKRTRITKACDVCYNKKIKCDGATPQCEWCAHRGLQCSYERRIVRKRRSKYAKQLFAQHRSHLLDRVDRLERLLANALAEKTGTSLPRETSIGPSESATDTSLTREDDFNNEAPDISTPSSTDQPVLGSLHFAGWRLGSFNSRSGIPVFSELGENWIRSRTGQDASLERITALRQSWHNMARSDWGLSVDVVNVHLPIAMPDRQVVEKCLALYCESFLCCIFPVVDPVRLQTTISAAYSSTSGASSDDIHNAQACVFAFLAFVSFFNVYQSVNITSDAEKYSWTAHRILMTYTRPVTAETLQTSCMLMLYHLFSGDLANALIQDSVATRIVYMLGAHTTTYPSCNDVKIVSANSSYRERYLLRNIFWLIYMMDKELSLRTGQPPCLQDEHCDISFPPTYARRIFSQMMGFGTETDLGTVYPFPGSPELSIIKSKAYNALYSARALRKTDAEILRDIRELDDDLECWRLSVPLSYRPTVAFARATLPEDVLVMPSTMLHLDYNHCVAAIHQATSRCQAWISGNQDAMDGVGSSLELSIEASRSSLVYLQMASHLLDENSFWMVLYYPMSALLTLFYGILHRPLAPQSHKDLELLRSVPSMIRRIPISRWMEKAVRQIQAVDELVAELTTLGQSAIDKATRETETRRDNGSCSVISLINKN